MVPDRQAEENSGGTYDMRFHSLLSAGLGLAFSVLAPAAMAQDFDAAPYAAVKGWQVDALSNDQGFLGCAGSSQQAEGYLILMRTADGWKVRVPSTQTESYAGALITIDGRRIESQAGFAPEGAAELLITDQAAGWIANGAALTVEVDGDQTTSWVLSGSAAMIGKVNECYAGQGLAPAKTAAPAPAANVDSDALRMGADCPAVGEVVSGGNTTAANVTFYNASDVAVSLYWLDFNGMPVEYAGLLPGEQYVVDTWTGHYWLAKDFDGNCHGGVIQPAPGAHVLEIY